MVERPDKDNPEVGLRGSKQTPPSSMERISWSHSSDRHQRTIKTNIYKDASTSQKGRYPQIADGLLQDRHEVNTTKALLESLDKLRFQETKGDTDAEVKRAVICGRDQTVHRVVDLLKGLTDADIATLTDGLTPSQSSFILHYCRRLLNGVGFLQGPAGSAKTTIIKVLTRTDRRKARFEGCDCYRIQLCGR